MEVRIIPENHEIIAVNATNPLTINVGKFGTSPVLKNFNNIGKNISAAITNRHKDRPPKNSIGR